MPKYEKLEASGGKFILFVLYNRQLRVVKAIALCPYSNKASVNIFKSAAELFSHIPKGADDEIRFSIVDNKEVVLVEMLPSQVELMKLIPLGGEE